MRSALLAVWAWTAREASAQDVLPPSEDELASIRYEAPGSCPRRAEFLARIRARSGEPRPDAATRRQALDMDVQIVVRGNGVIGSITIDAGDGAVARRRIHATSCHEASEALALIAALALDSNSRARAHSRPVATSQPAGGGADPPAAADRDSSGRVLAPATVPAPSITRPEAFRLAPNRDSIERDTDGPIRRGRERSTLTPVREALAVAPGEATGDSALRQRLSLFLSGGIASGVLPAISAGLEASARYVLAPRSGPEFGLVAGWRIARPASERRAEGELRFAWWSAFAALCVGARRGRDAVATSLCFAAESGALTGSGRGTENARSERRLWAAIGAQAAIEWEALPPFVLQAGAAGLFPLIRDRFLIADQTFHRAEWLGLRAELGVGVRIW